MHADIFFMRYLLALFFTLSLSSVLSQAEVVSCECPELRCDQCMEEEGVKFYSEKCGPSGARIRSCAKPTCVPKDPLPKGCDLLKLTPFQDTTIGMRVAAAATQKKIKKTVER
ncbi:MAG: hypothetical protein HRT45_07680, partial [Bdellovibrionales bacterium]|nr:hypothetical protein [Bdellovibrionales bacterium]